MESFYAVTVQRRFPNSLIRSLLSQVAPQKADDETGLRVDPAAHEPQLNAVFSFCSKASV